MSAVAVSMGTRTSLVALQSVAAQITATQTRIATGRRVNSAFDDPAAFFTATTLSARAAALTSLNDGVGNAKQVLQSAASGIDAVQSMISAARDVANSALASTSTAAKVTGTVASLTGATALSNYEVGDTITVNDGTTTATYTYAAGNTLQHFIDAVNNTANLNVVASLSADGRVLLTATNTNNIVIGGSTTASEKADIGLVAGTTTYTLNSLRQTLAKQFDSLRGQIDAAARDAGYLGTNLLAGGALEVTFNEAGDSSIIITGSTVTASGLGIGTASSGGGLNFQLDSEINAFLTALDTASATLEAQALSYQSNLRVMDARASFTDGMIKILQSGVDDLLLSDTNEDSALMLALQARQQLASSALSMTAQEHLPALRMLGWA